jgi:hypothetical protein
MTTVNGRPRRIWQLLGTAGQGRAAGLYQVRIACAVREGNFPSLQSCFLPDSRKSKPGVFLLLGAQVCRDAAILGKICRFHGHLCRGKDVTHRGGKRFLAVHFLHHKMRHCCNRPILILNAFFVYISCPLV